ncbi:family 16 glycosylhydrolase [Saccharicrinis aurantiacus]|uniref:family 16 glycosylhydrolase n=1 Tax=Saccharicrinis aurantiacus TaxID=1849719 RepID=UPI0024903429|nr:family 16 glycosylhydrolase [Saccharicrinis aurantiacus]
MQKAFFLVIALFLSTSFTLIYAQLPAEIDTTKNWYLSWHDEFDYPNSKLDDSWDSQNGSNHHILCSRWRENAVVKDGLLYLENRKENKGGQEWTSGSIWTKKRFKYGYFECRYKYAAVEATNNSFWLMTRGADPKEGKRFEIDINEGHYPNEMNTNIHQWSDFTYDENGKKKHYSYHKAFPFGAKPGYSIQLEIPVKAQKVRLQSNNNARFNIGEFRVYGINNGNYPDVMSPSADTDIAGLKNLATAKDVKISSSGSYKNNNSEKNLIDGKWNTSWSTQEKGNKWIEFEWDNEITIGCIQFLNGWRDKHKNWHNLLSDYKVQYFYNGKWNDISVLDVSEDYNFGEEFHTYGLLWDEENIVFYFDGQEVRREKNDFCFSESPIWLSLAIIKWSGPVTDAIDGTSMKVDYVRYYQKK